MRLLSGALNRYRGPRGLASGWEEYQYMDTYEQPGSPAALTTTSSNDAGTGFWSSAWDKITDLGSTYIQTEAQRKLAESLAKTTSQAGSSVSVDSSGAIVKTTYQPLSLPSSSTITDLLKNPLVLVAGGFIAYKLLKKKR